MEEPIRLKLVDRRQLLYLGILGAAVFLLLPRVIGLGKVIHVLQTAAPVFLALALAAETARYLASAASTCVLARLFKRVVPFSPMAQTFFVGAAANRVLSTGGAPGMLVRLIFLTRQGVPAGGVATIFLIEDIAGLVVGGLVLLAGVVTFVSIQPSGVFVSDLAIALSVGSLLLTLIGLFLLRYRAAVEWGVHWLAREIEAIAARVFQHSILPPARVQRFLNDFYAGLSAARRAPSLVAAAFFLNLVRHVAGLAALYFTFLALDQAIAPGILILIYTSASLLSTTSAVPGEVAIMGGGFAVLFLALGLAPEVALLALLLSRAVTFWLPLPIGYLALLNLRRQRHL